MTAEKATQEKESNNRSTLPTLTLTFAVLTLTFALISMISGNRLVSLYTDSLKAEKEAVTSEAASTAEMQNALGKAKVDIEAIQKNLKEEKAAANKLRKQLSAANKDLEHAKTSLVKAKQTITELKSKQPPEASTSDESLKTDTLSPPPTSSKSDTSSEAPAPLESPLDNEPVSTPSEAQSSVGTITADDSKRAETSSTVPRTEDSKPQADNTDTTLISPISSTGSSSVSEESVTEAAKNSPTTAPAAD